MVQSIKNCFNVLNAESKMLNVLYIRNYNQHRHTKLFNYMKEIMKIVKLILSKPIETMVSAAETQLLSLKKITLSQFQLKKALVSCQEFEICIRLLLQSDIWLTRAGRLVRHGICQGLFVPLYAMWTAIIASIRSAATELVKNIETIYTTMSTSLQEVGRLNASFAKDVSECTAVYFLDIPSVKHHIQVLSYQTIATSDCGDVDKDKDLSRPDRTFFSNNKDEDEGAVISSTINVSPSQQLGYMNNSSQKMMSSSPSKDAEMTFVKEQRHQILPCNSSDKSSPCAESSSSPQLEINRSSGHKRNLLNVIEAKIWSNQKNSLSEVAPSSATSNGLNSSKKIKLSPSTLNVTLDDGIKDIEARSRSNLDITSFSQRNAELDEIDRIFESQI